MADKKTTPENPNAETRLGKPPRHISERGKVVKKTCVPKLVRNFVNVVQTVGGTVVMVSAYSSLEGDWRIHAMWAIGVTIGACISGVWWLASKRE